MELDIFGTLLWYQCNPNLKEWLEHAEIRDGRIEPKNGLPLEEGVANDHTKAILVVSNGEGLKDRLKEDRIVLDEKIPDWEQIKSGKELIDYIIKHLKNPDKHEHSYIVDTKNGRVTVVREFRNDIDINGIFLPKHFLSEGGKITEPGLRTRTAFRLPYAYSGNNEDSQVESNVIKQGRWGSAGMGVVAQCNKYGLEKMAYMKYKPGENLPYINEDFQIALYLGRYEKEGKIWNFSERIIPPKELEDLGRSLNNKVY